MNTDAGWKRIHVLPRRYWRRARRGTMFEILSATETGPQRHIRLQSEARYLHRPDAYGLTAAMKGEIGAYEGIRFITTGAP